MQEVASGTECRFAGGGPECEVGHPWQLFQSNFGERAQSMACSIQQRPEDARLCRLEIAPNLFLGAPTFFLEVR